MRVYADTASLPFGGEPELLGTPEADLLWSLVVHTAPPMAASGWPIAFEPAHVARQGRAHARPVDAVAHAVLPAGLLDDPRERRVVQVADAREQVVLHLEVQPAEVPGHQPVAAGEVHRGLHLVDRPARAECRPASGTAREVRLLHAVRELEHRGRASAPRMNEVSTWPSATCQTGMEEQAGNTRAQP